MQKRTQSNIFEYTDYRQFLADYYSSKKVGNPSYSHRLFAKQAGLSSPSHLLMIIKGTRNLTLKTIPKFAEGLRLTPKERTYFERLVLFNQAEDLQVKAKYFSEILSLKGSLKDLYDLEREKFDFLSKWHVAAIYVLVDLKDFHPDPTWIAKRLGNQIKASQAREALTDLQKLGMIEPDPNRGFRQVAGAVEVADDTRSLAVYHYHQSMIRLAEEALKRNRLDQREMNGVTVPIPISKLPELKEKIRAFRKEINRLTSSYENSDEVYQLNIQLFPLTTPEDKK